MGDPGSKPPDVRSTPVGGIVARTLAAADTPGPYAPGGEFGAIRPAPIASLNELAAAPQDPPHAPSPLEPELNVPPLYVRVQNLESDACTKEDIDALQHAIGLLEKELWRVMSHVGLPRFHTSIKGEAKDAT